MKLKQIECSETSAYKIQTPGNYPEENIQHTEHGEKFEIKNTRSMLVSNGTPPEASMSIFTLDISVKSDILRRNK
jgi:hypothetical protein